MPAKFLQRTEFTSLNEPTTAKISLVKAVEADTPALLQTEINDYLLALPAALPSFNYGVIQIQYLEYTNAPPNPENHFVAYINIWFEGRQVGNTPDTLP